MIPVDELQPHPDNPRKDLGDLTELADSIRANGIFQNLTVLRDCDPDTGKSTVIIGHRRLAAAKLAGLKEVPCMVVEMDEKEQISTMLLENMQRSDLTIYEQAQGFQMMLDMGETQDSISEKTGFSKTTVRHRLKLLELDPEEFRKAQERQPNLSDYIRLEKITDPKLKSKALAAIGTANFDWTVENCLRRQREADIRDEWLAYIDKLFVREDWDPARKLVKSVNMACRMTDEDKAELDKLEDSDTACTLSYCYTEGNLFCYILGEKQELPKMTYEEDRRRRTEKIERIRAVQEQAQKLRKRFIRRYSSKRGHRAWIMRAMFLLEVDFCDVNWNRVADTLGILPSEDGFRSDTIVENSDFVMACIDSPDKVLLAAIADYVEDNDKRIYAWDGSYSRNEELEHWYRTLEKLGYSISDDEKAMLNGTHECFGNNEEEN
jgi:ParB family chromosome partitioning protein